MARNAGQDFLLDGFRDHTEEIYGRTVQVGESGDIVAVFEVLDELDPDFDLVKDHREACRMHVACDVPVDIDPADTVTDGETFWRIVNGSRRQNPITTTVSWLVAKIIS